MRTKLTVVTALAGTLFATCLVTSSAQAASVPVLKSDATPGIVTLVGKKGGGGGGGKHARGGGGKRYAHGGDGKRHYGGGGGDGKRHYGGGGDGKRHYGGGDRKHYAYKRHDDDDHDGRYRRYFRYGGYGTLAYGYYGGCGWLYRNAIETGDPYWWNRYYECTGYY